MTRAEMVQRLEAVARAIEKGRAGEGHAEVLYAVRNALVDGGALAPDRDEYADDQGRRFKRAG